MATQLRRYEIEPGKMDEFIEWFAGLVPVRASYGLSLDFAYADHENNQWIWSTSFDGDVEAFEAAAAVYNESPERAAVFADYKPPVSKLHVSFVEAHSFN